VTRRTLLIGLDGATFSILDPLIEAGVMPALGRLIRAGVRAELASVIPPLTPPAWTSLMTGRSPGNHGIFDFLRFTLRADKRELTVADSRDVACETLWSLVSRQGLRVNVLNFPLTFPAPAVAGNLVPGWVPWRHLRLACHPPGLYDELKALPGFDARELAMDMALEEKALEGCQRKEDYAHAIRLHIRREQQWFAILRHLMYKDPAALTAILFDGVDKLQHFCWRFIDPACFPAAPSTWEVEIRELCLAYYREVDRLVGEAVALAGPGVTTVIASDHGFGPTRRILYLNAWLAAQGYLAWAGAVEQGHAETLGLGTMARRFYEIDWERTQAYCPTPSSNGIYLGPAVGTGPERAALRARLAEGLRALADPVSGEPLVEHVWTREEAFAGSAMAGAPDLTLGLTDGGFVSILPSTEIVQARAEVTGTHRPNGIFCAHGPGLRAGLAAARLSILDVAPLLLHSLDLPVPADLEGRVVEGLFEPAHLATHPIRIGPATRAPAGVEMGAKDMREKPDPEVQDEVLKQLRALGYME